LISKTRPFGANSYFLSNPRSFFFRFADTGFKNKWTGFWSAGTKFVEFFDFRIGGEFLGEQNCDSLYYDFLKAIHSHALAGGQRVNQKVWLPRQEPFMVVELLSKKEIEAVFELAVNIRSASENVHGREYVVKKGRRLAIESSAGKLLVSVLKGKYSFEETCQYKRHFPSGEEQSYFLPGSLSLSGKRIVIQLSAGKSFPLRKNELLHKYKRVSKTASRIVTDSQELNRALEFAVNAIELLRFRKSFVAGLPWFQQYWGRDLFWSIPAMTELGLFEECRNSFKLFAAASVNGQIPNYLFGAERSLDSIDATPLFLIALEHYVRHSGDTALARELSGTVLKCVEFLESRQDENDGFVCHDSSASETWMDSLNRHEKAVEVQALLISALRAFASLVSFIDAGRKLREKAVWAETEALRLSKTFENRFFCDGFFADRICDGNPDKTRRVNALVPLFLGVSEKSEVLGAFESDEFLSAKGVCSISRLDSRFSPDSYHEGRVWSLGNAWLSGAEFLAGKPELGWRFFNLLASDSREDALGCIGECWNPVTLKQTGCPNQLWGNAMLVRLFLEFALGLRVNALAKSISLKPVLGSHVSRVKLGLRLGSREGILLFDSKKQKAVFSLPGYRVEVL